MYKKSILMHMRTTINIDDTILGKASDLTGIKEKTALVRMGLEALIAREPGPFCFGEAPTIADLCLVPQLFNARRFGVDVSAYPRLLEAEAAAEAIKAFTDAAPDRQPDAE